MEDFFKTAPRKITLGSNVEKLFQEDGDLGSPEGEDCSLGSASSATNGALFKEESSGLVPEVKPKGLNISDAQDTLMGRLASRMAARDMIDELDLGPKGRAPNAKQAVVADNDIPRAMRIEGPALSKGTEIEKEHTKDKAVAQKIAKDHLEEHPKYYDEKEGLPAMEKRLNETASSAMVGPGLHTQMSDAKASNFSNPIPEGKVTPGANMADQAKAQGNVYGKYPRLS